MSNFSWIPIYKEIANKLLTFENKQDELIALLEDLKGKGLLIIKLTDEDETGPIGLLTEIDPFTFFANWNRGITDNNRKDILSALKKNWKLESAIPDDFSGIPVVSLLSTWFFSYKTHRKTEDIPILWSVFKEAIKSQLTSETFNSALNIKNVKYNLTMGLFWIAPDKYLNLDSTNREYLQANNIIVKDMPGFDTYFKIMDNVKATFNKPFFEISKDAWGANNPKYWVLRIFNEKLMDYCLKNNIWMMQYQYGTEQKQNMVTLNWSLAGKIKNGDNVLLQLKDDSKYYAWGKACNPKFQSNQIENLENVITLRTHKYNSGIVTFEGIDCFYENLSDIPPGEEEKWGQRIDVHEWLNKNTNGVSTKISNSIKEGSQRAVIKKIDKAYYEDIQQKLQNYQPEKDPKKEVEKHMKQIPQSNTIYYGPPGTGKTYQVMKMMKDLAEETVNVPSSIPTKRLSLEKTFWHLAPGRHGLLWNILKKNNKLGYNWCKKKLGDLNDLSTNIEHYDIIHRFSYVKKGDYFVVISGREVLGIAEALHDYEYSRAMNNEFEFQTIDVKWIEQFSTPLLLNTTSTPTFSELNDGRRWDTLNDELSARGYIISGETELTIQKEPIFKHNYMIVTFHPSYSYEDFIEGIKPSLDIDEEEDSCEQLKYKIEPGVLYRACDFAAQNAGYTDLKSAIKATWEERCNQFSKAKPYYLVIDEISRGNVANIFGELITLIETDKRLGQENELVVGLPYSKGKFGVPSNLVILATMNTADRSVEALDIALRRRFSFEEVAPNPSLIDTPKELDLDLTLMLTAINKRLELVLDNDHCIGHSYLMGLEKYDNPFEELQVIFKNKIIPLLHEYFYGAPEKIGMILGKDFIQKRPTTDNIKLFPDFTDGIAFDEKTIYSIVIPTDMAAYRRIYEA